MGAVEGKRRDGDVETLAVRGHHAIGADHDSRRRRQRRTARVFETVSGMQHRLLADDASPADLLGAAERIGDAPIAGTKLDRLGALVFDAHVICPNVVALLGRGLVLEASWLV